MCGAPIPAAMALLRGPLPGAIFDRKQRRTPCPVISACFPMCCICGRNLASRVSNCRFRLVDLAPVWYTARELQKQTTDSNEPSRSLAKAPTFLLAPPHNHRTGVVADVRACCPTGLMGRAGTPCAAQAPENTRSPLVFRHSGGAQPRLCPTFESASPLGTTSVSRRYLPRETSAPTDAGDCRGAKCTGCGLRRTQRCRL